MRAPIVAIETGGEIHVFPTVEEAEAYIEPVDVQQGEYRLYDAEGTKLVARVDKAKGRLLAPATVSLHSTDEHERDLLKAEIERYLSRLNVPTNPRLALGELVDLLLASTKLGR